MPAGLPISIAPNLDTCLDNPFASDQPCLSPHTENVLIRDRMFQTRPGLNVMGDTFGEIVLGSIGLRDLDDVARVIVGTSTKWRRFNNATHLWNDISGGVALSQSTFPVTFTYFFQGGIQYVIGVNGVNPTKELDLAAANYVNLANAPIARTVTTVANRLMFGAISVGANYFPQTLQWTTAGLRNVFPALAKQDVADTPDHIVQIGNLGRRAVAILKENSQWLALSQPGSDAAAFEFQLLDYQPGPIGPAAGDRGPGGLQWIYLGSDGNIRAFDGVKGTIVKETQKYIGSRMNFNRRQLVSVKYFANRQEIWCLLPLDTDNFPTHLMIYSYRTNGVYLQKMPVDFPLTHLGKINAEFDVPTDLLPDLPTDQQADVPTDQLGVTAPGDTILAGGQANVYTFEALSDVGQLIQNNWQIVLPILPGKEYEFDGVEIQFVQATAQPVQVSVLAGQNCDRLLETVLGSLVPSAGPAFMGETISLRLNEALRARIIVLRLSGLGFFQVRRLEVYAWARSIMA